jgi:hypothetical protein
MTAHVIYLTVSRPDADRRGPVSPIRRAGGTIGQVKRANRAVLITDAQRSQEDQLRIRQTRYILMMSVRVLSLIVAAVLVSLQPPLLWLWLSLCAFGMIVIPWLAVVLANDRLPKDRHRWRRYRADPAASRTLGSPADPHRLLEHGSGEGTDRGQGSRAGTEHADRPGREPRTG